MVAIAIKSCFRRKYTKQLGKESVFFLEAINVKMTHLMVCFPGLRCNVMVSFFPTFPHFLAHVTDPLCFLLSGS